MWQQTVYYIWYQFRQMFKSRWLNFICLLLTNINLCASKIKTTATCFWMLELRLAISCCEFISLFLTIFRPKRHRKEDEILFWIQLRFHSKMLHANLTLCYFNFTNVNTHRKFLLLLFFECYWPYILVYIQNILDDKNKFKPFFLKRHLIYLNHNIQSFHNT